MSEQTDKLQGERELLPVAHVLTDKLNIMRRSGSIHAVLHSCTGQLIRPASNYSALYLAPPSTAQAVESLRDLMEAMQAALHTLRKENDLENSAIQDTIWHTPTETLFDFMDAAIKKAEADLIPTEAAQVPDMRDAYVGAMGEPALAQVEPDAKDADRYRWLRDQRDTDGIAIVMKNEHFDDALSNAENINRFIDAAIASAKREG